MQKQLSFHQVLKYTASPIRDILGRVPDNLKGEALEIRIRQGRPLALVTKIGPVFIAPSGSPEMDPLKGYVVTEQDCRLTLQLMTRSSVYMVEDKLVQGFLTLPGGHRVGVAGSGYVENGRLEAVRDLRQLNIRLAREVLDAAAPVLPALVDAEGRFQSTLVISPPGCGKTTLIRDIARQLSWGKVGSWLRHTAAIVDERSEIGAVWDGEPQNDCGPCTDVLDGYPKAEGIAVAMRALAPDVLVTDELGTLEDAAALIEAAAAGITVLASIHGDSWEAVQKRPGGRLLAENRIFRRLVVLSRRKGPGTVEKIEVL